MLQNGAIVAGKYKILQKIGEGGMSTVYLAEDLHLNKKWTVKEIIKSGQEKKDQVNLQSLIAEANLIKKIDHPAVPRIVDIIDTKSTVFIVRDYVDGEPMHQVIRIYGAQPENAVVEWAKQLCDVLNYLHHMTPKVIYRDMKPSNIMLMPDGSLRLIDFGIAQEVGVDENDARMRTGTKGYAPAEQMRADRKTDERSDIYALGMTLYQIATGISPASAGFDRNKPVCEQNPKISARLSRIIDKCIQENPDDRYQNCAELQYALGKIGGHDQPEGNGSHAAFQKIGRVVCLILFFAFVALGLLSSPDPETGGLLHWAVDGVLHCKNIYFLGGILLLLFYMLLRRKDTHDAARSSADGLKAANNTIVVSNAQEGSMMDLLRTGSDASGRFGRSMDTSEAVRYSSSDLSDDFPAKQSGGSGPIRPVSIVGSFVSNRNDRQPDSAANSATQAAVVQPPVSQTDETLPLDSLLQDDVTQSLDSTLQDDVTQSLDSPLQDDVTLSLDSPLPDDVTQSLDIPLDVSNTPRDDVTQFLEPIEEEPEAPRDDVTQFLEPMEEEPEAPRDDVTQFLEPIQAEAPFDPLQAETEFFDVQEEETQFLAPPEPDETDTAPELFRILRREIVVHTDETIL